LDSPRDATKLLEFSVIMPPLTSAFRTSDVVSLVEKAAATASDEEAKMMQEKMMVRWLP
jgi:hypothetical protein